MKKLQSFATKYHWLIAAFLLALMLVLGIGSMRGDSAIVDEVAHIPAGYSYLRYGDYRLNPEHPPLIKELAAAPLLFLPLRFPNDISPWTSDVNGQWESGWHFIYHYGNNADQILFYSRLPILLLAILFGGVLYVVTKRRFGAAVGLLALFFYALEPNILAHARFVTTDLGAAATAFFAIVSFLSYLKNPSRKNLAIATVLFAVAQLAKFSAVLLVPVYFFMVAAAIIAGPGLATWRNRLFEYVKGFLILGFGALGLIWAFYIPPTWNLPASVQSKLIDGSLPGGWQRPIGLFLTKINHLPLIKPLAQYILGVLMVFNRVAGGNTTYFMGKVTNQSFVWYFPVTYLIKTPITILILIIASLAFAVWKYLAKSPLRVWQNALNYARDHLFELTALFYIAFYSYMSIKGNLNLGIRHLLPIIPFILILVAKKTVEIARSLRPQPWAKFVLAGLLLFYLGTNLRAYPSYLAYFNESIGGPANADKYVSDSSVDWGQDLIRLKTYVDSHPEIDKIAVDYFGGGEPKYYFCDRRYDASGQLIRNITGYDCSHSKFVEWHAQNGIYPGKYMAVSETFLLNDIYWSVHRGDTGYAQLRDMQPIAKIGYSIYVYKVH